MNVRSITGLVAVALLGAALIPTAALAQTHMPKRMERQHARILEGVNSGQLTHREAHHLRVRDHKIHESAMAMRARHDGKLTHLDRRVLRDRMNATSKAIYRDKHNDKMHH